MHDDAPTDPHPVSEVQPENAYDSYKVGDKRPPKEHQFKKGKSGNPAGRPKGSKNLSTEIAEELNARAQITHNGKRKNIPMKKVIAKQLVGKAAKGEDKAIATILNHERLRESTLGAGSVAPTEISDARDKAVLNDLMRRFSAMHAPSPATENADTAAPADIDHSDQIHTDNTHD